MADIDLPVFSFSPNWADGIVETLEWRTDILGSYLGHEQRRKLRLTPRRFFEADFNPVGNVRSFLSLWLQRFAEQEFLMPLWHDKAKLDSDVAAGATRIDFDNTFREFEAAPGLALVRRNDFDYEVVSISAQDDDGIDLAAATEKAWPASTVIYPLRPAVFDDPGQAVSALTSRVGQTGLTFRCTRPNPYASAAETLGSYAGFPVIVKAPNREDALRVTNARRSDDLDNDTGRVYRRDEAGRAFAQQRHDWRAVGRQQHHELRQTLYRLEGRQKALWLPTFNQDAIVASDVATGANTITIGEIGYGYLGGPVSGRRHFLVRDTTGTPQIVEVISVASPSLDDDGEVLTLSANTGFSIAAGTPMSFVELMRLDQDAIELTHYTDTDGVADAAAAFRAFRDGRTTAGNLIQPSEEAVKGTSSCGSPALAEDSPCLRLFQGWYYKVSLNLPGNTDEPNSGSMLTGLSGSEPGQTFEQDDGLAFPDNETSVQHVYTTDLDTVVIYFVSAGLATNTARELSLQMQRFARSDYPDDTNSGTIQRWDGAVQTLVTRQSSVFIPGADSDGGNGKSVWRGAGSFPDRKYFGVA